VIVWLCILRMIYLKLSVIGFQGMKTRKEQLNK